MMEVAGDCCLFCLLAQHFLAIFYLQSVYSISGPIASIFHTLESVMTALLAFIFLSRTMTVLQWIGLGLIMASVVSMQMVSLVQNRKR